MTISKTQNFQVTYSLRKKKINGKFAIDLFSRRIGYSRYRKIARWPIDVALKSLSILDMSPDIKKLKTRREQKIFLIMYNYCYNRFKQFFIEICNNDCKTRLDFDLNELAKDFEIDSVDCIDLTVDEPTEQPKTPEQPKTSLEVNNSKNIPEAVFFELQCKICLELFDTPVTVECGHTFCSNCINQSLAINYSCPLCRLDIYPIYNKNNVISNLIGLLKNRY